MGNSTISSSGETFCSLNSLYWFPSLLDFTSRTQKLDWLIFPKSHLTFFGDYSILLQQFVVIENVRIDPSWIVNVLSCLKTWIISCFSDNWKSNFSHLKAITKAALTLSKPKKLSVAQHGKTSRDNSSFLLFLRISYSEFPKKNSQNPFPLSFYIFFNSLKFVWIFWSKGLPV